MSTRVRTMASVSFRIRSVVPTKERNVHSANACESRQHKKLHLMGMQHGQRREALDSSRNVQT